MRRPSFWRSQNLSIGSCRCLLFVIPEGDLRFVLGICPCLLVCHPVGICICRCFCPIRPYPALIPPLSAFLLLPLPPRPPVPVLIPKDANPGPHHGDLRPPRHHRRPSASASPPSPPPSSPRPHTIAAASHSSEPSSLPPASSTPSFSASSTSTTPPSSPSPPPSPSAAYLYAIFHLRRHET